MLCTVRAPATPAPALAAATAKHAAEDKTVTWAFFRICPCDLMTNLEELFARCAQRNIMARRIIPNHVQYVYALKFSSDVKFAESIIQPTSRRQCRRQRDFGALDSCNGRLATRKSVSKRSRPVSFWSDPMTRKRETETLKPQSQKNLLVEMIQFDFD